MSPEQGSREASGHVCGSQVARGEAGVWSRSRCPRPRSVPRRSPRVSMAAANLENQLHSAQKNLLFLQREHAGTLRGLHAEIRRLQQHCTGAARGGEGRGGRGSFGRAGSPGQ